MQKGNEVMVSIRKFQEEMRDLLNSDHVASMLIDRRYSDVESEVVRLRKKIVKGHDSLLVTGYLDGLISRALLFRMYGMFVNLVVALEKQGLQIGDDDDASKS